MTVYYVVTSGGSSVETTGLLNALPAGTCPGYRHYPPIGSAWPITIMLRGSDGRTSRTLVINSAQIDCVLLLELDYNATDSTSVNKYVVCWRVDNQCTNTATVTARGWGADISSSTTPGNSTGYYYAVANRTEISIGEPAYFRIEAGGTGSLLLSGTWTPAITLPGANEPDCYLETKITIPPCTNGLPATNATSSSGVGGVVSFTGSTGQTGAGGGLGSNGPINYGTNLDGKSANDLLTIGVFTNAANALDTDLRRGFAAINTNQLLQLGAELVWMTNQMRVLGQIEGESFTNLGIQQSNWALLSALGGQFGGTATNTSNTARWVSNTYALWDYARSTNSQTNHGLTGAQMYGTAMTAVASVSNAFVGLADGVLGGLNATGGHGTTDASGLHFNVPFAIGASIGVPTTLDLSFDPCDYGWVNILLKILRGVAGALIAYRLAIAVWDDLVMRSQHLCVVPQARATGQSVLGTNLAVFEALGAAGVISGIIVAAPTVIILAVSNMFTLGDIFGTLFQYAASSEQPKAFVGLAGTSGLNFDVLTKTAGAAVTGAWHLANDLAPIAAMITAAISWWLYKRLAVPTFLFASVLVKWVVPAIIVCCAWNASAGYYVTNELVLNTKYFDEEGKIPFPVTNGNTYAWDYGAAYSTDWLDGTTTEASGSRVATATGNAVLDSGHPEYSGLLSGDSVREIYFVETPDLVTIYGQNAAFAFGLGFLSAVVWEILGWSLKQVKGFDLGG